MARSGMLLDAVGIGEAQVAMEEEMGGHRLGLASLSQKQAARHMAGLLLLYLVRVLASSSAHAPGPLLLSPCLVTLRFSLYIQQIFPYRPGGF